VSRRHVVIERQDTGYVLRDVGSLNGTYVNRERVD
jgi:pSer/pThr/pTyr-binding forkhead associated (FHA) protein